MDDASIDGSVPARQFSIDRKIEVDAVGTGFGQLTDVVTANGGDGIIVITCEN